MELHQADGAGTLVPCHNGPRSTDQASRFTIYQGGDLATITFPTVGDLPRQHRTGSQRGKIAGFSKKSRQRLIRRLASVNKLRCKGLPAFVTLTYHVEYPDDPSGYRGDARAFLKRLRRRFGDRPVIWRLEFQKRGAPHFHMLVFDLEVTDAVKDWIRDAWHDIAGAGSHHHLTYGTDVKPQNDWRQVRSYLAKYIAKPCDQDGEVHEPVGRWWGIEQGDLLPVDPVSFVASLKAGLKIRRAMQKAARIRPRGDRENRGLTTFLTEDTAVRLVLFYGGRIARPIPSLPDAAPPGAPPGPDAGRAWRMNRHAWVSSNLNASCRLK